MRHNERKKETLKRTVRRSKLVAISFSSCECRAGLAMTFNRSFRTSGKRGPDQRNTMSTQAPRGVSSGAAQREFDHHAIVATFLLMPASVASSGEITS